MQKVTVTTVLDDPHIEVMKNNHAVSHYQVRSGNLADKMHYDVTFVAILILVIW